MTLPENQILAIKFWIGVQSSTPNSLLLNLTMSNSEQWKHQREEAPFKWIIVTATNKTLENICRENLTKCLNVKAQN